MLRPRAVDGLDKGIIPLTCSELFVRVAEKSVADEQLKFTVEVSYIEVCRNVEVF
jgi:kinesin family protein 1